MDTKKKISMKHLVTLLFCLLTATIAEGQNVNNVKFYGAEPELEGDKITLKFSLYDDEGKHIRSISPEALYPRLQFFESEQPVQSGMFQRVTGGVRIPKENTISVLIDRGIDREGKMQIFDAVRNLVFSAPDSCVYISFFDERVSKTLLATSKNYEESIRREFEQPANGGNFLYSALYSKLHEFNRASADDEQVDRDYEPLISQRARENRDKIAMFVFVDGSRDVDLYDMGYNQFVESDIKDLRVKPTIYAFYYTTGNNPDEDVSDTLKGITGKSQRMQFPQGEYVSTDNHAEILKKIGEAIEEQMYDYVYVYQVSQKAYSGKIPFAAEWDGKAVGEAEFAIGTEENPWPSTHDSLADLFLKFCIALLASILTVMVVFALMKILVPSVKSKVFSAKYYKKYVAEPGVQRRICTYCKHPIEPGQMVVTKCKHIMHVGCWKQNDYRCAEYGQNCNVGIQEHVDWDNLFTRSSFRDCYQAISGIVAGFVAWIVYELTGRGFFQSLASSIASLFFADKADRLPLLSVCSSKVASFFAIGLLLGFFLSCVFRWNEEYRRKNGMICLKIFGLSLLSSLIGFFAFAFGGIILCMMASSIDTMIIPWYCSLPAYLLFSICTSLSLTIKTSIPVKSAMLGGLCSAIVGFLVLYFTKSISSSYPWMNMLLDFILYGGGLGASLLTVRMLAEKYFLVIQNGVKAKTRIPIHKWMNATGGGNKVTIGMTGDCEIQMNWEKSNKVAKEHAVLYIDPTRNIPVIKPLATKVIFNARAELPVRKPVPLNNGDTIKIGDTIFVYEEMD